MKVLMLTQVLPHPQDSGPKVKTGALLRALVGQHEVTLVSFTRGAQSDDVAALRQVCRAVHAVPLARGPLRDAWHLGRSLLVGQPFLMARDERAAMHALVRRLTAAERFDVVHIDQLNMAQYALAAPAARVLDAHNALWVVTERLARTLPPGPRRLLLTREARLLRAYEGRVCDEVEAVLAVSEEDRAALCAATSPGTASRVAVVPIAVDVARIPLVKRASRANRILHIGSLIWPPTADGLTWFLRQVWPAVRARRPDAELDVVGGSVPHEIAAWGGRDVGVHVHGYIADPTPLLERAGAMIVPLRAGGGMRVRILNAFAQGVPMVTTSVGCEGIAAKHEQHLLIADDGPSFAAAVLRLLAGVGLADALVRGGRELVREKYDVRVAAGAVGAVYGAAVERRRGQR